MSENFIGVKTLSARLHTIFGNKVIQNSDNEFYIVQTGEPYNEETHKTLVCPKCGKTPTAEGHDPCIANLPGVEYACCGHGVQDGYMKLTNGVTIYGVFLHMMERVTKEEFKAKSAEPGFDPRQYEIIG